MYYEDAINAHVEETVTEISEINNDIKTQLQMSLQKILSIKQEMNVADMSVLAKMAAATMRNNPTFTQNQIHNARQKLLTVYQEIQQIRTLITGQVLVYHLYITTPDNQIQGIEIGEAELARFIRYESDLRISTSAVQQAILECEKTDKTKLLVNQELQQVYNDVLKQEYHNTQSKKTTRKKQRYYYLKDSRNNKIIRQTKTNKWQKFNLGHIGEALDKVRSRLLLQHSSTALNDFFEELRVDSVSGFFGGDNAIINAQVKVNHAQLMAYSTIAKAADSLLKCINLIANDSVNGKQTAKSIITNLYGLNNNIDTTIDQHIDIFLNQLIEQSLS